MITAKFNLEWQGGEYSNRVHKSLVQATKRSAILVRDTAKKLLNTSGKGVVQKSGINDVKGPGNKLMPATVRKQQGLNQKANLKTVNGVKSIAAGKSMIFGGSLTYNQNIMLGKMVYQTNVIRLDRIYWYGEPLHRWVQSSPPGSPPHKQRGTLQQSITVEPTHAGLRAKIGPAQSLIYSRIQELGGKGMINLPARPYMRPAFESQQQAILFQFALAVQRAAK